MSGIISFDEAVKELRKLREFLTQDGLTQIISASYRDDPGFAGRGELGSQVFRYVVYRAEEGVQRSASYHRELLAMGFTSTGQAFIDKFDAKAAGVLKLDVEGILEHKREIDQYHQNFGISKDDDQATIKDKGRVIYGGLLDGLFSRNATLITYVRAVPSVTILEDISGKLLSGGAIDNIELTRDIAFRLSYALLTSDNYEKNIVGRFLLHQLGEVFVCSEQLFAQQFAVVDTRSKRVVSYASSNPVRRAVGLHQELTAEVAKNRDLRRGLVSERTEREKVKSEYERLLSEHELLGAQVQEIETRRAEVERKLEISLGDVEALRKVDAARELASAREALRDLEGRFAIKQEELLRIRGEYDRASDLLHTHEAEDALTRVRHDGDLRSRDARIIELQRRDALVDYRGHSVLIVGKHSHDLKTEKGVFARYGINLQHLGVEEGKVKSRLDSAAKKAEVILYVTDVNDHDLQEILTARYLEKTHFVTLQKEGRRGILDALIDHILSKKK